MFFGGYQRIGVGKKLPLIVAMKPDMGSIGWMRTYDNPSSNVEVTSIHKYSNQSRMLFYASVIDSYCLNGGSNQGILVQIEPDTGEIVQQDGA